MAKYFKQMKDTEFYNLQKGLSESVNSNAASWNIPAGTATELANRSSAFAPVYKAVTNKMTRTSQHVRDHRAARKDFERFIEGFARAYIRGNPLISDSVKTAVGFKPRSSTRKNRSQINEQIMAKMDSLGGSKIRFTCRSQTDSSRASMLKNADAIEVRYVVGAPPATVDGYPMKELSTRAKFILDLQAADAGKKIYARLRWRNNTHVHKSGPWCAVIEAVVG